MSGSWVNYVKNRIERNKNFLCIFSGPTGSGKSWSALRFCQELDEDFNIDRVVFKGKDLMNLINGGTLSKGSVILWDETQIDLNNRNWQSLMNKMLNYLISTFRHKNFILIFTAPYTDFIDSATLKMFHANFEVVGMNKSKGTVKVKPLQLQYDHRQKKWYRHYLRRRYDVGISKLKRWNIPKPSKDLIKAYESKKTAFTTALNNEIESKLNRLDGDGKAQLALTPIQDNILKCWKKGITDVKEVAELIGETRHLTVAQYPRMAKRGYDYKNYEKEDKMLKLLSNANNFQHYKAKSPGFQLNLQDNDKKNKVITLPNGEKLIIPNAISRPGFNRVV
jgi:hypothetical protein